MRRTTLGIVETVDSIGMPSDCCAIAESHPGSQVVTAWCRGVGFPSPSDIGTTYLLDVRLRRRTVLGFPLISALDGGYPPAV